MVAVAPSRLALTTTPSMAPSAAELTWPASAAGACAWTGTAASTAVIAPAVRASRKLRDGIGRLLDLRSPHRRRVACHELASREPKPAPTRLQDGSGASAAVAGA